MPPPTEKEIQDEAERAAAEERARLEEERKKQEEEQEEEEEDEVSDLNQMRVVDLRAALRLRNLSATGNKAELIARLTQAVADDEERKKKKDDKVEVDPGKKPEAEEPSPSLEDVEKQINQGKAQKERREQQLKKVNHTS